MTGGARGKGARGFQAFDAIFATSLRGDKGQ
jgi:hypothetical protein